LGAITLVPVFLAMSGLPDLKVPEETEKLSLPPADMPVLKLNAKASRRRKN
jgi:hypothetical protein